MSDIKESRWYEFLDNNTHGYKKVSHYSRIYLCGDGIMSGVDIFTIMFKFSPLECNCGLSCNLHSYSIRSSTNLEELTEPVRRAIGYAGDSRVRLSLEDYFNLPEVYVAEYTTVGFSKRVIQFEL